MAPLNRQSWKNYPMPAERELLPLDIVITHDEYTRLCQGHRPENMDDKWFIFHETDTVYFCRSWTGDCIFQLTFENDGDCMRSREFWVNRNTEQYNSADINMEYQIVQKLLSSCFNIERNLSKR